MAEIKGSLHISAPISPYSSSDTYPTHLAIYGKGGIRSVETLVDRNNIPEDRREEGMLCYVVNKQKIYGLRGGIANENWVDVQIIIGGDNAGQIIVSISEPDDPSATTFWFNPDNGNIYSRDIGNTQWIQYVPPLVDGGEF